MAVLFVTTYSVHWLCGTFQAYMGTVVKRACQRLFLHSKWSCKHAFDVFNVMVPENLVQALPMWDKPSEEAGTSFLLDFLESKHESWRWMVGGLPFCHNLRHALAVRRLPSLHGHGGEKSAPAVVFAQQMELQTHIYIYIYNFMPHHILYYCRV